MIFSFPVYALYFFIGTILALYLAFVVYQRRPAPGTFPFTIFILAVAWWTFCYGLEAGATQLGDKILWAKFEYCGIVITGLMWICFTLDFTGNPIWRKPRFLALMLVVPISTLVVVWTNEWHHWFWSNVYASNPLQMTAITWEHGFWYPIIVVWQYSLFILGIIILITARQNRYFVFRRQVIILVVGTLVPLIGNIIYNLVGPSSVLMDLTPLAFIVAALFYGVTLLRFGFLDVVPVARGVLVEKMPDGILVLDKQGIVMDINPGLEKIFAIERKIAIGSGLEVVWPLLKNEITAKTDFKPFELMTEPPLTARCLEISLTPILDNRKSSVGQLIVLRDVSERRQIEQTLRESEARYATLVEQSNESVMIVQDDRIKFANHTLSEITGYNIAELTGQSFSSLISEEDQAMVEKRHRRRIEGEDEPDIYEIKIGCKSGEKRDSELSIGDIVYEGKSAHIVSARDISERKQTQRQLEGLYEEERKLRGSLQEEIEKRSKYTRALVHELNTPLTSILASGELLEAEVEEPTLAALVKNIRRASHNLKQRIDELIELARGEIGMLKINAMPVDMERLLREVESEMRPLAKGKGLELKVEVGELPLALGDRGRLRQVLLNLISNALKFTKKGEVEVKGEVAGEYVKVSVRDSGRGIGKEQLENIFDPYRRKVNEGQEMGGLGIGLTLSKMFVDLHRGEIKVESEVGRGSVFSFTIPFCKEESG